MLAEELILNLMMTSIWKHLADVYLYEIRRILHLSTSRRDGWLWVSPERWTKVGLQKEYYTFYRPPICSLKRRLMHRSLPVLVLLFYSGISTAMGKNNPGRGRILLFLPRKECMGNFIPNGLQRAGAFIIPRNIQVYFRINLGKVLLLVAITCYAVKHS